MRKWIAAALLVVFALLAASVVFPVQVTSADPLCQITYNTGPNFNNTQFTLFSPVDGWHQLDFGDGSDPTQVEVIGGRGTSWHDYPWGAGNEDYHATVSGPAGCMIVVIISNPDQQPELGGGGETPVGQPAQVPTAPLGCDLNTESEQPIAINGNHVTGSIQIQGGDKEWPLVDYFGLDQDTARREDNTIWINGHVPLGADGVFSIRIINRHSGVVCRTYEFRVQDNVVFLNDGTSAGSPTIVSQDTVSLGEVISTEGGVNGWVLYQGKDGWWRSTHSWLEGDFRFLGICPEATSVAFNADATTVTYQVSGVDYTTPSFGKDFAEGCRPS